MTLTFNVSENETLALTEQFYKDSASHQRLRNRTRWVVPLFLLPIMLLFTLQFGLSLLPTVVFLIGIAGWFAIAPLRFDARIKRYAIQQMKESSYAKSFGKYVVQIGEANLVSDGPTGHTEYNWDAIDRAILTDDYLFVFLSGPMGLPIKTADIGHEDARRAYAIIQQRIATAK